MLLTNPTHLDNASYQFLPGIDPYSCGVIANPGYEIVHVTLTKPILWRDGFRCIAAFLQEMGQPRQALCAMQLRCPKPFTIQGFIDFNQLYCQVLADWGIISDRVNPVARTNVAPVSYPLDDCALYAFSYAKEDDFPALETHPSKTFVVAGAGELRDGILEPERIIRSGEVSTEALLEKATYVMEVMSDRLHSLGANWSDVTQISVYTAHPADIILERVIHPVLGQAYTHATQLYLTRPPVEAIEFEMDLRGIRTELQLDPMQ